MPDPDRPIWPVPEGKDDKTEADRRDQFSQWTAEQLKDPGAERAFILGRMEMIRTDPRLSESEKEEAIAELKRKLGEK